MRDQLDQATFELPTIPPAPKVDREPRTKVADRKRLANYMPPKQVESCRNCRHVRATMRDSESALEHETHRCNRHSFGVLLGAICDDYVSKPA
jgi:hypothetical protein